jgi:beta-lactam-binding protein with PASTA domain
MKQWVIFALSVTAACSFKGNLGPTFSSSSSGGGGSSGAGPSEGGHILRTVPSVIGQTPEQALATMRAAGFEVGGLDPQNATCGYDDDRQMVKTGTICSQTPGAGTEATTRLPRLRFVVEKDTYAEGGIGLSSHWRRMPEVVGLTLAEATAVLAKANLALPDHFVVSESAAEDCQPEGKICLAYPKAGARKQVPRKGRIVVGVKPPPGTTPPSSTPEPTTYF